MYIYNLFIIFNRKKINISINKNIDYNDLTEIIKNKFKLDKQTNLLILHNNKFITQNNFKTILRNDIILDINVKIKGGVIPLLYAVLYEPITGIIKAIVKMSFLLGEIIGLFQNLVTLAISIFNPSKVIDDVLYAATHGVGQVIRAFIEKIDFSQNSADNKGDGGPFGVTEKKRAICVPPSFVNLLILVLCPPLAMFLHKGMAGFFVTLICGLLTYYLYYFPGFIFAALHILC